jgi:hypothetical protein
LRLDSSTETQTSRSCLVHVRLSAPISPSNSVLLKFCSIRHWSERLWAAWDAQHKFKLVFRINITWDSVRVTFRVHFVGSDVLEAPGELANVFIHIVLDFTDFYDPWTDTYPCVQSGLSRSRGELYGLYVRGNQRQPPSPPKLALTKGTLPKFRSSSDSTNAAHARCIYIP